MTLSRRGSIRAFGIGLASLMLARCKALRSLSAPTPLPSCYTVVPMVPPPTLASTVEPPPTAVPGREARDRLWRCWVGFDELAYSTNSGQNQGKDGSDNPLGESLSADHRQALDELVTAGQIEAPVADLVQEAYDAAIYHVWRSNAPITCYEPAMVDYAPVSAGQLVRQSDLLVEMAGMAQLFPNTVASAQKAIERDLAFEALTNEEVQALYQKLTEEHNQDQAPIPSFDEAPLDITPEVQKAAQFLVDLLSRP